MKTIQEKNKEIKERQSENEGMGKNDKLYNESMSKNSNLDASEPNSTISRFKVMGVMPVLPASKFI